MGIALGNMTRMERGETWGQAENVTPNVGRLLRGPRPRAPRHRDSAWPRSPHDLSAPSSVVSACRSARPRRCTRRCTPPARAAPARRPPTAATSPRTCPSAWSRPPGSVASPAAPPPLHEAGVAIFSAMYGRDFAAENDLLAALDIDSLSLAAAPDAVPRRLLTSHDRPHRYSSRLPGRRPRRRRADRGRGRAHALPAQRDPVAHRQGRCLAEVREPAVHRLVQGARRAEHAAAAHARGAQARRHRDVGRQPRAGRRLSRGPARHPGDHRHAVLHAQHQGHAHARPRRARSCCTATRWPRPPPRRIAWPPRRSSSSSIPTTMPRIIAGQGTIALEMLRGRAGARHAGRPDRRRRHDRRLRRRGARAEARPQGDRRRSGRLLGDAPAACRRAGDGGRRHHRRGHRGARHRPAAAGASPAPWSTGASAVDEIAIERAIALLARDREDGGRGRGRRRPRRAARPSRSASPAARSASSCAAATSTPACSPRSCCAAWCATAGSCGCA